MRIINKFSLSIFLIAVLTVILTCIPCKAEENQSHSDYIAAVEENPGNTTENYTVDLNRRPVRVGIYQNPPKVFTDEQDIPSGIFIDLLTKIAEKENWDLIYVPCEWADCLDKLENNQIDLMPDVAYSRKREIKYDFHLTPVVDSWSQIYSNSSVRVSTLSDLNGLRIAILKGGIQEETFRQIVNGFDLDVTIVEVETYEEGFNLADSGSIDAIVSNHLIGDYLFQKYDLIKTPIVFNPTSLYFATAQGKNLYLLDAIDKHLDSWRKQPDSYYYKTLAHWTESPMAQTMRRFIWVIVIIGGSLVLSVAIIQLLRLQVKSKTRHLIEANDLLRKSEEKYRLLVENLNDVIFNIDSDGNFTFVSPRITDISKYSVEDLVGKPFHNFIHPNDLSFLLESRKKTIKSIIEPFEFRVIDKDGSVVHARTSSRPIIKDGKITGITGVLTDITLERRAEEALRESEEKHRAIINTIEDGYFEVDLKGSFTFFNESMRKMLGYSQEEMLGLNYRQYMSEETTDNVFSAFNKIFRTGIPTKTLDWQLIRKDETTIDIETSISLKRNDSFEPIGFFGIARDVTEKKKMEEQLIQVEKLSSLGGILSGVAHELNNPLTAIIGNAQMLMRRDIPSDIKGKLEVIEKESIRSSKIVGGLLAFARKHKSEKKMIQINDVIVEAQKLREYELRVDNIILNLDLDKDIPRTCADPYQLQQVFVNLINNAHDALQEKGGGTLDIRTSKKKNNIVIEFEDNGIGMQKDLLRKIFDPFFTTKETGKGTGLGLSIVYGIIADHDGVISVSSEVGKVTKFTIELPIVKEAKKKGVKPLEKPKKPEGEINVLVVEDEKSLREFLVEALKGEGYSVLTTDSGKEALGLIDKNDFDVIISDMKMPGISGQSIYNHVQKQNPELAERVVFITGDILGRDTQNFLNVTGAKYIEKPFQLDDLFSLLTGILTDKKDSD